jgi:hypothetical protein
MPIIGNNVTAAPNQWNLTTASPGIQNFRLGKYINEVKFASPIQSVTAIDLKNLQVQGIGNESLIIQNLTWFLNFVVYYSFEGE